MRPVLHITLLGTFGLRYEDVPVLSVAAPRLQSLLAYLVLNTDAPQQRRYVAFRFWPDSAEGQARTNLRQLLHHLRRALPDADRFIEAGTHSLRWRTEAAYRLDVDAFSDALAHADRAAERNDRTVERRALDEAVGLYTDDLLPGCYDEWIEPERERIRQQYLAVLDRLILLLEEQRAYREAIEVARRLQQKEPLRETTYRTLMRLHALRDDRAGALRVYQQCITVLNGELNVEPSPGTRELYERLFSSEPPEGRRLEAPPSAELPLVGRHPEWKEIQSAWRTATREQAGFVLIAGEAGIGKSRLAEEHLTWAGRQGVTTARTRCYAAEGRLAFAPVADWLRTDALHVAMKTLDPVWRSEVSRIRPELAVDSSNRSRAEPLTRNWQRRRFFEALARAVTAASQPIALLIDDMQWCDQDTLEWIHFLLRFDANARMLVLGTARIEEVGSEHPLEMLLADLRQSGLATEIVLGPLDAADTAELAGQVAHGTLAPEQAAYLYKETEGNPLFVVESVRAGRTAAPDVPDDPLPLPAGSIDLPPKVHSILGARLTQCSSPARELAYLAAVIGRAFSFDLLAVVSGLDDESLIRCLDELWQRRVIREYSSNAYDFSHDKLRDVAYTHVRPVRRDQLHRRVAEALEALHGSEAPPNTERTLDGVSGQIAAHYDRGGLPDRALPYYERAARVAQSVFANEEAIMYLNRALRLLAGRPPLRRRDEIELSLLVLLGSSLAATRGFAASETGDAYDRARSLCRPDGDPRLRFAVYWGSYAYHVVRADLRKACHFSEECRSVALDEDDSALFAAGDFALGASLAHLGQLEAARKHLEQACARYEPGQRHFQEGADLGVFSQAYLSHTLWLLGYPDQAVQRGRAALALSKEVAHPFSRVIALSYLAMLYQFRGESQAASGYADTSVALSAEHGFPYYEAWGTIIRGWALHHEGKHAEGRARMHEGLDDIRSIGTGLREPHYLALLTEAHRKEGNFEKGLATATEALDRVERTEERWQEAELYRLRGELLSNRNIGEAEASFRRALEIARTQNARSFELRAAASLGRFLLDRRRHDDARWLLQPVYAAFDDGFSAPDLQAARRLLDELS